VVLHPRLGRDSSQANGGQIPAGDAWVESSCATGSKALYEVDKVEDPTGTTVTGHTNPKTPPPVVPCDAAFGAIPSLTNSLTDYDLAAIPSFPNDW
jgi:hypothetical protein